MSDRVSQQACNRDGSSHREPGGDDQSEVEPVGESNVGLGGDGRA